VYIKNIATQAAHAEGAHDCAGQRDEDGEMRMAVST